MPPRATGASFIAFTMPNPRHQLTDAGVSWAATFIWSSVAAHLDPCAAVCATVVSASIGPKLSPLRSGFTAPCQGNSLASATYSSLTHEDHTGSPIAFWRWHDTSMGSTFGSSHNVDFSELVEPPKRGDDRPSSNDLECAVPCACY